MCERILEQKFKENGKFCNTFWREYVFVNHFGVSNDLLHRKLQLQLFPMNFIETNVIVGWTRSGTEISRQWSRNKWIRWQTQCSNSRKIKAQPVSQVERQNDRAFFVTVDRRAKSACPSVLPRRQIHNSNEFGFHFLNSPYEFLANSQVQNRIQDSTLKS